LDVAECSLSTLSHTIQFLITVGTNLESLDDRNTVFGFVAEGMEVVQKINEAFVDKDGVSALCLSTFSARV
jgi:cyclophilin family peptidyl-prolyl cis-trans isomerase